MARNFSTFDIRQLEKNPNVLKVSDRSITYHPDFKKLAVHRYKEGISPTEIFLENGFDLSVIGKEQPKRSLQRWRETFDKHGDVGLENDRRGKGSTGRPSTKELSPEEKLKKAEAQIEYLKAENEFLKKLEEMERQAVKKKRN